MSRWTFDSARTMPHDSTSDRASCDRAQCQVIQYLTQTACAQQRHLIPQETYIQTALATEHHANTQGFLQDGLCLSGHLTPLEAWKQKITRDAEQSRPRRPLSSTKENQMNVMLTTCA